MLYFVRLSQKAVRIGPISKARKPISQGEMQRRAVKCSSRTFLETFQGRDCAWALCSLIAILLPRLFEYGCEERGRGTKFSLPPVC